MFAHKGKVTTVAIDALGNVKDTGGEKLKESQAYAKEFGVAMCAMYQRHQSEIVAQASSASAVVDVEASNTVATILGKPLNARQSWSDAAIEEVLEYLR